MAYVPRISFQFYSQEFRGGMDNPPINQNAWGFLERTAWSVINWKHQPDEDLRIDNGDYPLYLKLLTCRIAEIEQEKGNAPKAGSVIAEKNFSYSVNLKDVKDTSDFDKQSQDAIKMYLFGTALWSLLGYRAV